MPTYDIGMDIWLWISLIGRQISALYQYILISTLYHYTITTRRQNGNSVCLTYVPEWLRNVVIQTTAHVSRALFDHLIRQWLERSLKFH